MASHSQTKICAKCKRELSTSDFHRRGGKERDRFRSRCKTCATEDRKPQLGTIKERSRKWRDADPERAKRANQKNREKHIKARREYDRTRSKTDARISLTKRMYREHRAERIAKQKARNALRQAEIKAYRRQYWRDNPDKAREYHNRRRALKRNAPGSHTAADIADIRRLQKDRCANPKCRKRLKGKGHIDHRHALINGGSNDRKNLQLLCGPCNSAKRAKDEIIFMQEQGLLL